MAIKIPGVKNIEYFTHGKRGDLYRGFYRGRKVVIKTKRPQSKATGRIRNEGKWLEILNNYGIGPKLVRRSEDYVVYYYVAGEFIQDYLAKADKRRILEIIRNVLEQMRMLDKLKVDKEEMHHPVKHIIINDKDVILLDFERSHNVQEPKNVTQFCQFLVGGTLDGVFREKGIKLSMKKMISLTKKYKHEQTDENFNKILELFE